MPPHLLRTSLLAAALLIVAGASPSLGDTPDRPSAQLASTSLQARSLPATAPAKQRARPKSKPRRAAATMPQLTPSDPLFPASWSLAKVRASSAWRSAAGAAATVVAVLDTGVDPTHPDLAGAVLPGWDAVNEDADAADDHGHGTFVAGVIAARANNGIGGVGACWTCSVLPVKVIGGDGTGSAADIAEGLVWAADHGANVINMSFVLSGYDSGVAGAIQYARAKGALVVAAAGNSGTSDVTFPASEPGVLGVTATDANDGRFSWATFGSWVAVAAPGCSHSTAPAGGYGEFCGTSSAAALASGVAALVRSASPGASAEAISGALTSGAAKVGDFVSWGRLDVADALTAPPLGRPGPAGTRPDRPEQRPDRL